MGRVNLATQFAVFVAALLLALIAVVLVAYSMDIRNRSWATLEKRAAALTRAVEGVATGNQPLAERAVAIAEKLDGDPDVWSHVFIPAGSEAMDVPAEAAPVTWRQDGFVHVTVPVLQQGQVAGVARFALSLEREAAFHASSLLWLGGAFILIAVPLAVLFAAQTAAPLRRLIARMRGMGGSSDTAREDELGELARLVDDMRDRLSESEGQVRRLMSTDALTGLPNRDSLRFRMAQYFAAGQPFALFIVDIDRLGRLNAALGSHMGDALIMAAGLRLSETLEAHQTMHRDAQGGERCMECHLMRFGSDEFVVLLACDDLATEAEDAARRFAAAFEAPLDLEGRSIAVTVSIGAAIAPADGATVPAIERSAHLALDEAKAQGPGSYRIAKGESGTSAYQRLIMEDELRRAIENGELLVYFQPQVDLRDGSIIGAEALVRWNHPVRGIVGPVEFIELAEEIGVINKIGSFVLRDVAQRIAGWAQQGFLPKIAVNISASQCTHGEFCAQVFDIMSSCGAPPSSLQIELTETVAMSDPARTARQLAPLRAAGVRLAMDDFGTGYSNLAMLTRLPFDVLKIDRSFVGECARDGAARVVVATILTMAQNLGYQTVAEGVETEAQREFLLRYGCTYAQGYLFARPMPADDFERMFTERRRADARDLQERVRSRV